MRIDKERRNRNKNCETHIFNKGTTENGKPEARRYTQNGVKTVKTEKEIERQTFTRWYKQIEKGLNREK